MKSQVIKGGTKDFEKTEGNRHFFHFSSDLKTANAITLFEP
jgi:hypothetical protein